MSESICKQVQKLQQSNDELLEALKKLYLVFSNTLIDESPEEHFKAIHIAGIALQNIDEQP